MTPERRAELADMAGYTTATARMLRDCVDEIAKLRELVAQARPAVLYVAMLSEDTIGEGSKSKATDWLERAKGAIHDR